MKAFGWTIEYTLSLTFPVFLELFELIRRVRMDAAIDEFYTPYSAVKFGGKCAKTLFDGRGRIWFSESGKSAGRAPEKVTPAMIRKALKKAQTIAARNQERLAEAAAGK